MTKRQILKKYRAKLLKKKNVHTVGLGYKITDGHKTLELSIICSVEKKVSISELSKKDRIPKEIKGVLTDVIEVGKIKAFLARTDRWRPAPGGVSIGHEKITAGTLGCLVKKKDREISAPLSELRIRVKKRSGEIYILSNNHVLAQSNQGAIGSAILQPGKADGGEYPKDRIATLTEFVEIKWLGGEGCKISKAVASLANIFAKAARSKSQLQAIRQEEIFNLVDAAIARPNQDTDVMNEILDIGLLSGEVNVDPSLGMRIQKSGRTTAVTEDEILQLDVTTQVQYGDGKIALFEDQLMAGPMSAPGDSGSAILDTDNNLVGLLFAGSDEVTILNRIEHVFHLLDVQLL